jgi:hypothetical protein
VVAEAYLLGVSTRKVEDLVQSLGIEAPSSLGASSRRVCRATVYRLVADGRIPAVRISAGAIRVPWSG